MLFELNFGIEMILFFLVLILALLLMWVVYRTYRTGWWIKKGKDYLIDNHKKFTTKIIWYALLTVFFLELFVSRIKFVNNFDTLFIVHLILVGIFVISFLAIKFNGKNYPRLHKWLVYPLLCIFIAVALTGGIMFFG